MNKKKELSLDEEMLMWCAYRYCIGRKTYVTSLAPYIGEKYYPLLNDERAEHTARDIRNCIADVLNYGALTFRYDGTIMNEERDALSDLLTWLNYNVESEKDLIGIDTIECYKEDYKQDTPKKFFVTKKKHYELPKYETDFADLLEWHKLSSLFDRKNHVKVWVNYDGKEECVECFYAWEKALTLQDDGLYRQTPWKYKKCLISVDRYLELGEQAVRIDETFITRIAMNNKIYIAGRVSGIKYETAKWNFSMAERYWSRKGYEVVNPIKICKKEWGWWHCMAVCLWNLTKCKYAYFMPNYVYSKGARIEFFFAKLLRKKIYILK